MIYFAYGANIDPMQLKPRCKSAEMRGAARLDGYRLSFPRYSFIRQSAIASIEEAPDEVVWGALYEIAEEHLRRLDSCEGYHLPRDPPGNAYNRIDVDVRYKEGDTVRAFTYQANPMAYAGQPSGDYLAQIARCGAALGFPEEYLRMILTWEPEHHAAA